MTRGFEEIPLLVMEVVMVVVMVKMVLLFVLWVVSVVAQNFYISSYAPIANT